MVYLSLFSQSSVAFRMFFCFTSGDSFDDSLTAEAIELFEETPTIARRSPSPSRTAQLRSLSPVRGRSPAVADNTLAMVQSAIHKRGLQVQVCELYLNQV